MNECPTNGKKKKKSVVIVILLFGIQTQVFWLHIYDSELNSGLKKDMTKS